MLSSFASFNVIRELHSEWILAQVPGAVDLTQQWLSQEGGVLGMSLLLNVILLTLSGYLLRLSLKKEQEKTEMMQKVYGEARDTAIEMTKAFTELSLLIRGGQSR